MKRKGSPDNTQSAEKKRKRPDVPEYTDTPTLKDEDGSDIWPAPLEQMQRAREIIKKCAAAGKKTMIVPDKDADGLTSGVILYRTLELLGLSSDLIHIHLLTKGNTVHTQAERQKMMDVHPDYIFVLDQGSRQSPPLLDYPHTAVVIDHHHATPTDFPSGAAFVTACNSPPVATSSLLTYTLCTTLHPTVSTLCDWLAIVGTHGDLGSTIKWTPPFPDMSAALKQYTKKTLNDVVAAVNAPRRTPAYDVISAWTALLSATTPKDVLGTKRLHEARNQVADEVERCTHTAPKFSPDGRIAVFRINSKAQVHPVIATRWAGHLNSKALEIVMVANEGYLEGKVNFSCRVARCARAGGKEVDIIRALREYASISPETVVKKEEEGDDGIVDDAVVDQEEDAAKDDRPLLERLGDDFARGHVQASGGIVAIDEFEELYRLMRIGEKSEKQLAKEKEKEENPSPQKGKKKAIDPGQKNTLAGYFGKPKATGIESVKKEVAA